MTDLGSLKDKVNTLAESVKTLKANGEDVQAAIAELLAAKQAYADANNGIGVDGKPYQKPLSNKEKKAAAKAAKAAAAAQLQQPAEGGGGELSANAQKKAAKKAAKQAAKQAHKTGGAAPPAATSAPPTAATTPARPIAIKIAPRQLVINPNSAWTGRPLLTLTAAVLANTDVSLNIVANHKVSHSMLGLPDGTVLTGDASMARYVTPTALPSPVQTWMDYAHVLKGMDEQKRRTAAILTLERALMTQTYLVGQSLSLADVAMYTLAFGFPSQNLLQLEGAVHTTRWLRMMTYHPAVQQATQLALLQQKEVDLPSRPVPEPLVTGMGPLEGAVPGRVVTRFPPEPSGYLHIGHAKAVLLNDYYARRYHGRLLVRFDDTNPSKEKQEYQDSIVEDLQRLGVTPSQVSYTSDSFAAIHMYALQLIKAGHAFMDDTPQEQMKAERANRVESKHRNQTVPEALEKFKQLCAGEAGEWCLRAKIDMSSANGTMLDPVLYRQNLEPHHRTGTTYKAYPTYDLACPIVDSLEGVTHALRTTEYNDRDEQYQWILQTLGLRKVRIHAFSRVNFRYTVLSKRKLTWFVDNGHVTGWDDPRMPTIRGIVRRGVNVECLKNYMYSQGASRRTVLMDWSLFWSENKKEVDKAAKRFMAIDKENHVKLTVLNGPSEESYTYAAAPYLPKDPSKGSRAVRLSSNVVLEAGDVEGVEVGENIVLMRWGVVKITKVDGASLEGEYVPDGDIRAAKRKLTWMASVKNNIKVILSEFDNLVSKEKLEEEDNFMDFVNPSTQATTEVVGDAGLKQLCEHDVIQLERRGFYRVDRPYISEEKPLMLFMVPDGKTKSMSGMTGKLAHR